MATKHNLILEYIENLAIGEKISVRGIARRLSVSEGTAYRAIKDAENIGLVATFERVGTMRIEKKKERVIERLTYGEVVQIVEGTVIGGADGLEKVLSSFIIGAMKKESMARYILAGGLMIVGNRTNIHRYAIENQMAVLITGGFETDLETIQLADEYSIPIIRTTYDTFTVATMINRALSDRLIKKEIMHVSDVFIPLERTSYLRANSTVEEYIQVTRETGNTKIPIVTSALKVIGIVTEKDIFQKELDTQLERIMTKSPLVVRGDMSVASVSHQMLWEGLEMMPVVNNDGTLNGIIGRFDVMKAMQMMQRSGQTSSTLSDQITGMLEPREEEFFAEVSPQMVNSMGLLSIGVLSELIIDAISLTMKLNYTANVLVDQLNVQHLKMIPIESRLRISPKILDSTRRRSVVEVEIFQGTILSAKANVTVQILERS